jgi:hypothetical protein
MATSAKAAFCAIFESGKFLYLFRFQNTSPRPFEIYSVLIASQYGIPLGKGILQNLAPVSAPHGWQLTPSSPYYGFLSGGTNWVGNPVASGYIAPGATANFFFQSSTPPPPQLMFGCGFYNGENEWGFVYNGTAERIECGADAFAGILRALIETSPSGVPQEDQMKGTTTTVIGGSEGAPLVKVTYDRFGNIVRLTPNVSPPAPSGS